MPNTIEVDCETCTHKDSDKCLECVNAAGEYIHYQSNGAGDIFTIENGTDRVLEWRSTGIYRITTKHTEQGDIELVSNLWEWDEFEIQQKWENLITQQMKYDYVYQGKSYKNTPFDLLKKKVAQFSLMDNSAKSLFGRMTDLHMQKTKVPTFQYENICGFTQDGWRFPDQYRFDIEDELQTECHKGLEKMATMEINLDEAKIAMQELYENTAIDHKDLIFAIGMILPFQYAMQPHTKLSPHYTFYSPTPETGKTEAARLITTRWWGSSEDVFDKDAVNSPSRFGSFSSASTMGMVIDDCGELDDKVKGTIKTYQTSKAKFTRKNKDNGIKINNEYKSPWILTLNDFNKMFDDDAYLTRNVVIPMNTKLSQAQKDAYCKCIKKDGYFGNAIYTALKEITLDELITIFDEQLAIGGIRQNAIYGLVATGAVLFKRLFGIELNISPLSKLIKETMNKTSDDLGDAVRVMMDNAMVEKKERPNWIVNDIMSHTYKGELGYLITSVNRKDLNKMLNTTYSCKGLQTKLLQIFKGQIAEVTAFKVDGKKINGVWYNPITFENTNPKYEDQDIVDQILLEDEE